MAKGILIDIEGSDGAGKTTQVDLIVKRLESEGYEVWQHKFPTEDHVTGSLVYAYLKQEIDVTDMSGMDAAILYLADQVCWKHQINEALNAGKIVILDRYYNSNLIHQAAREWEAKYPGAFSEHPFFKLSAHSFAMALKGIVQKIKLPTPDKVVYLHASPELAAFRRANRSSKGDLHENNDVHEILATQFGLVSAEHEGWVTIDEGTVEEPLTIEEIHEQLYALVKETIDLIREDE